MTPEHLYAEDTTRVVIRAFFTTAPSQLFDYFVEPERLCQWWTQAAECDVRVGGCYCLSWPEMNWHLRGVFQEMKRGERLVYTWHWDHDGDKPSRLVTLDFMLTAEGGTRLDLLHAAYEPTDGQERQDHIDGWLHFLPKLHEVAHSA